MKLKSKKLLKTCALSLSLLLVGGIAVSPITKTYAQEPAGPQVRKNKKRIVIHYKKKNSGFKVYWWTETEQKDGVQKDNWAALVDDPSGDSATATIDLSYDDEEIKLGYIVATEGWEGGRDIKGGGTTVNDNRYVDLKSDINEVTLVPGRLDGVKEAHNSDIKHPDLKIADSIKGKQLPVKDIKVWKGENIDWSKSFDKSEKDNIQDEDVKKALADNFKVENITSGRDSSDATEPEGKKGNIKVTFSDGSSKEFENKLFVSDHIVGKTAQNTPEDAVTVDMLLGEGVEVDINKEHDKKDKKVGNKTNPVPYDSYKVKPGTDIKKEKLSIINEEKTIFDWIPVNPQDGYQNPKWTSQKGNDFVVTEENKVFTASADKKTAAPKPDQNKPVDPGKKPENKPEKPKENKHKRYYYGFLGGLGQMPNHKTTKISKAQYDRLRKAYEHNRTMTESARFLLEHCPETIKPVRAKLEDLLKKAEGILARTEKVLKMVEDKEIVVE